MSGAIGALGRRILFGFDPETAHGLSIAALKSGLPLCPRSPDDPRLAVMAAGLRFPNPLGMAAGYDKNAEVPDALLGLGFGFVEVGSITPRPQTGNPKPRIFRLEADRAVINRLGFNNHGHAQCAARLEARADKPGLVGVNIGANKDSADRMADYEAGVRRFAPVAAYLAVNISSPNTPGLRAMQARTELAELLSRVTAARAGLGNRKARAVPIFLKIAPDLGEDDLDDIAAEILDKHVEGVIVANTTLARDGLSDRTRSEEAGGLSGQPLFRRSTKVLASMRRRLGPKPVLIGVGGVDSAETALDKVRAGADLVQLYTGLIYGGPSLPAEILRGMAKALDREGAASLADLRDSRIDDWLRHRD